MQKCCGTYVPQHFLCLLTIRLLNIVLKRIRKNNRKSIIRKKAHKKDCKRRAFTVLKFLFCLAFFLLFLIFNGFKPCKIFTLFFLECFGDVLNRTRKLRYHYVV